MHTSQDQELDHLINEAAVGQKIDLHQKSVVTQQSVLLPKYC